MAQEHRGALEGHASGLHGRGAAVRGLRREGEQASDLIAASETPHGRRDKGALQSGVLGRELLAQRVQESAIRRALALGAGRATEAEQREPAQQCTVAWIAAQMSFERRRRRTGCASGPSRSSQARA